MRLETLFLPRLNYPPLTSFEARRTHENGLVEPHSLHYTPSKIISFLYIKKNIENAPKCVKNAFLRAVLELIFIYKKN